MSGFKFKIQFNSLYVTYRIKRELWWTIKQKNSLQPVEVQLTSWCIWRHREGMMLFRSAIISSAAASCGRKQLRVAGDSEKRTLWWNQEVKEAIQAKKHAFKALLQDRSSSDLQSRNTGARKMATSAVKKSKEKLWEEFGFRLDSNYFSANKGFWQTIRHLRGKRSSVTYFIKGTGNSKSMFFEFWIVLIVLATPYRDDPVIFL